MSEKFEGLTPKIENKEQEPQKTLYRYEARGDFKDKDRSLKISHPDLVGCWFIDNLKDLETYIVQRGGGGKIITVSIPENDLEKYKVGNHPIAKNMDIDLNEIIIPKELLKNATEIPVDILPEGQKRFKVTDFDKLREFLKQNFEK